MEINREELAWAAGFFDGEGCSACSTAPQLMLMIGQCNLDILIRFHHAVGLGTVHKMPAPISIKHSQGYRWQASTLEECQAVIAMLWLFLSPIKQEQYYQAMQRYKQIRQERNMTTYTKHCGNR